MRKLAIASLLVAGVALSGSVLAQDAAPQADAGSKSTTDQAAAPAKKGGAKHHKAHKAAAPAAGAASGTGK